MSSTKPGPLNDEEFFQVKMHPHIGAEIVGKIPHSDMMREAIEHHHQRFDGSGYPDGLRGEQIPLWARIIGLADAYANMVTEQSFSSAAHARSGPRRTLQDERHPLRWHARAPADTRTESGTYFLKPGRLTSLLSFRNGEAVEESAVARSHGAGHEQIPPSGRNDKCTGGRRRPTTAW